MDVQALFTDKELKFPHLNSSLMHLKVEKMIVATYKVASAKMALS